MTYPSTSERRRRLAQCSIPAWGSLRVALATIDSGAVQFALALDDEGRLVGTVSDGDIRRALLAGADLDSTVDTVCRRDFTAVPSGTGDEQILRELKRRQLHHMPVLDDDRRPVALVTIDDLIAARRRDNLVVVMAGGLGSRLGDLTRETPKPMLPVGGKPVLEHLLCMLVDQGFRRFRIAVNYRAEMIERHFCDGAALGCEIDYLRERERLGTAGALRLLNDDLGTQPLVVVNGDLMAEVKVGEMVDHHDASGAAATMGVRHYEYQVPYGVIRLENERIVALVEKPLEKHLIAVGIYVVEPEARTLMPADGAFDMPDLFNRLIATGRPTAVFPLDGYWADIGTPTDYRRVNQEV